jgi:FkbM family methyltransferase
MKEADMEANQEVHALEQEPTAWSSVAIIVLNWNGWRDTIECLESLQRLTYPNYQVIVVDNGSTDGSVEKIKDWARGEIPVESKFCEYDSDSKPVQWIEYDRKTAEAGGVKEKEKELAIVVVNRKLTLIQTGENLGFAGGNNVGLRYALSRRDFAYVWLLNNDTVVKSDALTCMVKRISDKPGAGMCGSTLPFYHDPKKIWALGGATYNKWFAISRCIRGFQPIDKAVDNQYIERCMDYIAGASILVSRTFLHDIGLMSEDYFLYFEEIDWAERARGRYTLTYAPNSIVYHKVGASTGSNSRSFISDYYKIRNKLVFTRKFFPLALPTAYLTLFASLLLRIFRWQWDRVWMIIKVTLNPNIPHHKVSQVRFKERLKEHLISFLPKSLQLPARYYYQKLRGTLEDELIMLDKLVSSGRAIDIGANYGVYSYVLSKLCERVEVFEPQPQCAATIIAHNKSNINVHNCALSNFDGSLNLYIPIINGRLIRGFAGFKDLKGEYERLEVPVKRLDDFDFRDVSFIKIDVEGHESEVLEGGRETILREKPIILVEIEQRHIPDQPMTTVFDKIISLGYKGFFLYRNKLTPLSKFSYEKHQQPYLNNVMCKDYINNFIFTPSGN